MRGEVWRWIGLDAGRDLSGGHASSLHENCLCSPKGRELYGLARPCYAFLVVARLCRGGISNNVNAKLI